MRPNLYVLAVQIHPQGVGRQRCDQSRVAHEWTEGKAALLEAFDSAGITSFVDPEEGGLFAGPKNLAPALLAFEPAWVTLRHPKGLSTGCRGEEPLVVWRFINERRAIHLNANCGWARGKAGVLYIADAFQVMPELNALLDRK